MSGNNFDTTPATGGGETAEPRLDDEAIRVNAAGPRRASGDSGSIEQHSLADQIAADRHLASKAATRRPGFGAVLKKLVPPGTD